MPRNLQQETHLEPDGSLRRCSTEFTLFGPHTCSADGMPPQSASRTEEGQQPLSAAEPQQCTEPSESAAAASRQSRSAQLTPSVAQQLSKLGVQRILTTDVRIASLRAGIPVPAPPRPPNPLPLLQSPPIHSIFPLRGLGLGNRFYFALNTAGGGAVVDPCGQLYIPIQPTSSNSP